MACERRKMTRPHPLFDHENFHFEELRQLIISYAIHTNYPIFQSKNGELCPDGVRICRLVNSDWLTITTKALRQARKPLFRLKLDQDHCFKGRGYFGKNGNKLLQLNQASPLALTIDETYFRSASSIKTIGQHLSRFQDNLVSLKVAINPKTSSQLFPGNFKLTLLQSLSVEFTKDTRKPASLSLQTVLASCPELQNLGFPSTGPWIYDNIVLPEDFSRVTLSKTLTAIEFTSKLENQHLEIMARSSLPKLEKFRLLVHGTPFEDGLIYRVLDNLKSSLEHLFIQGDGHDEIPEPPTYFRFPVMEKLKQLDLESQHLELEPGVQCLETFLPNLADMRLMGQTQTMLRKWTRSNSELTSVTNLYITTIDQNFNVEADYNINLSEIDTREIAHTFPNVKDFMIDLRHGDFSALKAVWQEMKEIKELTLFLPKLKGITCQDRLTSVLLGIPLRTAASLRTRTKRRKMVELNNISVKEMENLNTLRFVELESFNQKKNSKNSAKFPLLSDAVFELAFFEMPQLKVIWVLEKCRASQKITQEWKSRGRNLFTLE